MAQTSSTELSATRLPVDTTLGPAHLYVADLARAVAFYTDILGFTHAAGQSTEGDAVLTVGADPTPVLKLSELAHARRKPIHTTGLYHIAILTPSRLALARTLRRLVEREYPLQGASDHLVSEALYLADPDGNGLEIYRDRPRAEWRYDDDGRIAMDTLRLDLRALLQEAVADSRPWDGIAAGTRVGHVHLQVPDLGRAVHFYRDVVGFDLMTEFFPSAAFLSVGGYHHHLGLNTWAGVGAPPPPPDAVGLRVWEVILPDSADLAAVTRRLRAAGVAVEERSDGTALTHDPAGNAVLFTVGSGASGD